MLYLVLLRAQTGRTPMYSTQFRKVKLVKTQRLHKIPVINQSCENVKDKIFNFILCYPIVDN